MLRSGVVHGKPWFTESRRVTVQDLWLESTLPAPSLTAYLQGVQAGNSVVLLTTAACFGVTDTQGNVYQRALKTCISRRLFRRMKPVRWTVHMFVASNVSRAETLAVTCTAIREVRRIRVVELDK